MKNHTRIEIDTKTFIRFWGVLIGFVLVGLFIWKAWSALLMILIAGFIAVSVNPLVRRIDRWLPGKNRKLATALAYVAVVGLLLGVMSIALPAVIGETVRFVSNLPNLVAGAGINWNIVEDIGMNIGIENTREAVMAAIQSFSATFVRDFGGVLFGSAAGAVAFLGSGIIVLVMAFLMLLEGPGLLRSLWRSVDKRTKGNTASFGIRVQEKMLRVVSKYVTGQLTVSLVNWSLTTLSILIIGLIFGLPAGLALPFGVITGVLAFIPVFGSIVGGILVTILLAFSNFPAAAVFFIYYMIYLQLENNVISPRIQSKSISIPILAVIVAITIGFTVLGLFGAIVAIPIAGCIKVFYEEYMVERSLNDNDR